MQENYDAISAAGGSLITISVDTVTKTQETVDLLSLTFTVLSDTGQSAVSAYNVVSQINTALPRPSVFIIKTDGTIGWKSLDSTYSRTSASTIISALKELD